MRKHKIVEITAEGRDKGKHFLIVELSAMHAEKWATRAFLAMSRAGIEIPDEALSAGMAGLIGIGVAGLVKLPFEEAEPLLDEMLGCISVVVEGQRDPISGRPDSRALRHGDNFNDGDIEEISTLLTLRMEVAELHVGFSIPAALSMLAAARRSMSQPRSKTSRRASAQSSQAEKPA
jgi:hypothetical protein